jgi:Bacteriophage abortive infection AbiH
MNKLFLIGNGFDLAHGLKTKYSDFLLWYINKSVRSYDPSRSNVYDDKLIHLNGYGYPTEEFNSLKSFNETLERRSITFEAKNRFFGRIIRQSTDTNWVDIEYEYYLDLLNIFKGIEKQNIRKNEGEEIVKELNICFELIKDQLIEYLQTIKLPTYNDQIAKRIKDELDELVEIYFNEVLFLVFNYTKTIESYITSLKIKNSRVIYIHGQLGDKRNPIIFGYGDEMDDYYSKIESLNINEFLRNMKSFSYSMTENYQNLNRFINSDDYSVSIMGHSCGLSDRVLLNSLFCHQHCKDIRIYFYKKNEGENDYVEKTQEISRHFPFNLKNRMRNIIVPFEVSSSLT